MKRRIAPVLAVVTIVLAACSSSGSSPSAAASAARVDGPRFSGPRIGRGIGGGIGFRVAGCGQLCRRRLLEQLPAASLGGR